MKLTILFVKRYIAKAFSTALILEYNNENEILKLKNQFIVSYIDTFTVDIFTFIVLEYCEVSFKIFTFCIN